MGSSSERRPGEVEAELVRDLPGLTAALQDRCAAAALASPAGQPRIAERFALVAFAGELAIRWGLLPWQPGTATEALTHMARLAQPDSAAANNAGRPLERLGNFVNRHNGGIIDLEAMGDHDEPADVVGWEDEQYVYLNGDVLRDEFADFSALVDSWHESDVLVPGGEKHSRQYRMPAR